MSATPENEHLQSGMAIGSLLLTSGSFIRRVLYYNVYIYFFYTLPTKNKFITYNTLQNLTIFFKCTIRIEIHYFFRMFLL